MKEQDQLLCIDLGGTRTKWGIFNDCGHLTQTGSFETKACLGGEYVLSQMIHLGKGFGRLKGVALSSAAVPDKDSGMICEENPLMPGMNGLALKPRMEAALQAPCEILEDIEAFALAESRLGAGKDKASAVFLTLGTGLGCIRLQDKQFFPMGLASLRLGDGIRLEDKCSVRALVYSAAALKNQPVTTWSGEKILEQAAGGDPQCTEALNRFLDALGFAAAAAQTCCSPESIIFGGGILAALGPLWPHLTSIVAGLGGENALLLPALLGSEAPLYGARLHFLTEQSRGGD